MKVSSINKSANIMSTRTTLLSNLQQIRQNNNLTFKGQKYSFGYFTDKEITDTYKYMKYSDSEWRKKAESDFIFSMSFFEYVFGDGDKRIEKHLNEMAKLRAGLKEQERQDVLKREELRKINEKLAEQKKLESAKKEFQEGYITLINLENEEIKTQIPNGILIEKDSEELVENFINWAKQPFPFFLKEIEYPNNKISTKTDISKDSFLKTLSETLKSSKGDFEKKDKRTLLHILNFENLGEETLANKQIIATMKSLMSCCAEKYKCTILLDIPKQKLEKIDPILLVDSRIQLRLKL